MYEKIIKKTYFLFLRNMFFFAIFKKFISCSLTNVFEYFTLKKKNEVHVMRKTEIILKEVQKAVVGKEEQTKKVLMTILAKGHILLEDIPGVGKTTMASAFAKAMQMEAKRIQFTVDVLPSDVVGFSMIDAKSGEPRLYKGAVFCNIFLADEINRTSSKTQAALLEVMEEGQITIDGYTQKAPSPFTVIATQNPFGSAGTQLLPESQLDRFTICLSMGYPKLEDEVEILKRKQRPASYEIKEVTNIEEILCMQKECDEVYIHDELLTYIVTLLNATRKHPAIAQGASPRAGISLVNMAKACAYMEGRDYVVPKDIQYVFHDVIAHRIHLKQENGNKNKKKEIIYEILQSVRPSKIGQE